MFLPAGSKQSESDHDAQRRARGSTACAHAPRADRRAGGGVRAVRRKRLSQADIDWAMRLVENSDAVILVPNAASSRKSAALVRNALNSLLTKAKFGRGRGASGASGLGAGSSSKAPQSSKRSSKRPQKPRLYLFSYGEVAS